MFLDFIKSFFGNSAGTATDSLKGKCILIIDDGEIERKVYSNALRKAGAMVVTAADGRSGLEAVHSQKFNLILLDYMMPDMNGVDICRQLKADHTTREVPVIFLTGSVKPEGVITCYEAGADCYLTKPISADGLIKQVSATLQLDKD